MRWNIYSYSQPDNVLKVESVALGDPLMPYAFAPALQEAEADGRVAVRDRVLLGRWHYAERVA